jgi:hypothetical protein
MATQEPGGPPPLLAELPEEPLPLLPPELPLLPGASYAAALLSPAFPSSCGAPESASSPFNREPQFTAPKQTADAPTASNTNPIGLIG